MKRLTFTALVLGAAIQLRAQGYIVPNGVTYVGGSLGTGYGVNVVRDPTNGYTTGFVLVPESKTPPGSAYTNTYRFDPIIDVSVRVFLISSNQPITQQAIQLGSYAELMVPNSYVFNNNAPFYVGLYTGNQNFYPPNGIYSDPLFGWARLVNNQGVIEMLDSALVYKAQGILAGTQTIIPEPSTVSLAALGALLLGLRRSPNVAE
jgi:hypothetical protein